MKALRNVPLLLLLLALPGCKESTSLLAAHATPASPAVQVESAPVAYHGAYSGADIPASAPRGQVYEYH